jgi:hypothetical protein
MEAPFHLRTVWVTRYVTALREGGSMPAIAEADDGFLYALKFRGAGQGIKALMAELIGGEAARALGLKVPEIVLAQLDEGFGRTEPDEEIQDLLKASTGLNLALHYLSGAISFDPAVHKVDEALASRIVWLDAWLMNMDRTAKNTNMLFWNKELWLIDHGAALYFHHAGNNWKNDAAKAFPLIKNHVLLPFATQLEQADAFCRAQLSNEKIDAIVNMLPLEWLQDSASPGTGTANELRESYSYFLQQRRDNAAIFIKEANDARAVII